MAALLASAGMFACSATVVEVEPATTGSGPAGADAGLGNPGTLAPPTVPGTGAPGLLAIEPLIAFMDACVADAGLVGPCHCAADRIEGSLTVIDLEVFEDRMSGALEFSPELAGALVDCREAGPPPEWSDAQRQTYLDACSAGSDRMRSLCACSLARAQEVVPAHRLNDFLASNEIQPGIVDFLNLCL
ncbi:hypothetical protein [Candidatus Poriferisodalis sp.]|uniref:hypothetical protein n=1 Tax=Candidatus Poriferisodalis sp. TaxID=3101277 RepID=UPI003B014D67